ncbi:MAG: MHS family MFS transporter [Streptosporangiales bacterium]|nr:MHS family MFS transporter [Streptosporangiales bacterium]MBO0890248.1 MHS family MFS transporter [Acidothermales bacterium]
MTSAEGAARPVSGRELRTVVASSVLGTTIEWYDFFLYGSAASQVFGPVFFPSHDPVVGTLLSFTTFALGFVARPVGGLIFGHIGDRAGRKKTLVMTMLVMGGATFLIAFVPPYSAIGLAAPVLLVLLRLAQGIAIGGEWGGAVLLSVEYARPGRRGLYGSWPQLGLAVGLTLATGLLALLGNVFGDAGFQAYGWRIAFGLSALLVAVGLFVRLRVLETPAFTAMRERQGSSTVPARDLLADAGSRRNLLLGMGSRFVEGVAFNCWAVFILAFAVQPMGLRYSDGLVVVMVAAVVMMPMILLFGGLSDRTGHRRMFAIGTVIATVLAFPAFALLGTGSLAALAGVVLVVFGVCYPIMYGPQSSFYCSLFPTRVRYTGISLVYQFSGIVASGLTPLVLTALLAWRGTWWPVAAYLALAGVISTACTLVIRVRGWSDATGVAAEAAERVG